VTSANTSKYDSVLPASPARDAPHGRASGGAAPAYREAQRESELASALRRFGRDLFLRQHAVELQAATARWR
jgi:hypothetical protein